MITTHMINKFTIVISHNSEEDLMLDTVGDRILHLMRDRGRAERRREYTQSELLAMLTGDMDAPNGKRYDVKTNRSSLSRIISGDQKPSLDLLDAICDMFNTDLEWLGRGNSIEEPMSIEAFVTDEANEGGAMIDQLLPQFRRFAIAAIVAIRDLEVDYRSEIGEFEKRQKDLESATSGLRIKQTKLARLITDMLETMPEEERRHNQQLFHDINTNNGRE
jgi:Helix-turn-helix